MISSGLPVMAFPESGTTLNPGLLGQNNPLDADPKEAKKIVGDFLDALNLVNEIEQ